MGSILSLLTSIPSLIKVIFQILGIIKAIRQAFQKNPEDVIREGDAQQKDAQKRAEEKDDTGGMFGGDAQ